MGLMDKYNKGGVTFDIDITDFEFVDLSTLFTKYPEGTVFKFDGLYINKKSSFGDHPVAIMAKEKFLVDMPSHLTEDVKEMINDADIVACIKDGKAGFSVRKYYSDRYKKDCFGVHWEDVV